MSSGTQLQGVGKLGSASCALVDLRVVRGAVLARQAAVDEGRVELTSRVHPLEVDVCRGQASEGAKAEKGSLHSGSLPGNESVSQLSRRIRCSLNRRPG